MAKKPLRTTKSTRRSIRGGAKRSRYVPLRTGRRRGVGVTVHPYPAPPDTWKGTLPEWAIYWAHQVIQRREGEDFYYRYQIDLSPNGIDFYELGENIGIEIQGLFWHYGFGRLKQFDDAERKIRLEGIGIQIVFIDENHALADPVFYLKEALQLRDHSLAARGIV